MKRNKERYEWVRRNKEIEKAEQRKNKDKTQEREPQRRKVVENFYQLFVFLIIVDFLGLSLPCEKVPSFFFVCTEFMKTSRELSHRKCVNYPIGFHNLEDCFGACFFCCFFSISFFSLLLYVLSKIPGVIGFTIFLSSFWAHIRIFISQMFFDGFSLYFVDGKYIFWWHRWQLESSWWFVKKKMNFGPYVCLIFCFEKKR